MVAATKEIDIGTQEAAAQAGKRLLVARLISRTIFIALLGLIVLTAIPYGTVEPWWKALFAIFSFSLGILWAVEGALSGKWLVPEHKLLVPLAAIGLFAFAQIWPLPFTLSESQQLIAGQAISSDPFETKSFVLEYFALLLCGALFLRYLSNKKRIQALIWAVITITIASALFGILRQTTHHSGTGYILPYLPPNSGYGQFINKNHFALLMEMAFGLVAGFIAVGGARRDRLLLYLAVTLPIWTALVLSNSRGGIMGMISQVLFLVLVVPIKKRDLESVSAASRKVSWALPLRLGLSICLLLTIALGIIWVGGDEVVGRIESIQNEASANNTDDVEKVGRKEIWGASVKLIRDHWVAGAGYGAYGVAIHRYQQGTGQVVPEHAHNDYLELLASGGLIGAALMIWFIVLFIGRVRRVLNCDDPLRRAACYGALAGIFGVAIHSLVDCRLHRLGAGARRHRSGR